VFHSALPFTRTCGPPGNRAQATGACDENIAVAGSNLPPLSYKFCHTLCTRAPSLVVHSTRLMNSPVFAQPHTRELIVETPDVTDLVMLARVMRIEGQAETSAYH
jgi:hypothetical protein